MRVPRSKPTVLFLALLACALFGAPACNSPRRVEPVNTYMQASGGRLLHYRIVDGTRGKPDDAKEVLFVAEDSFWGEDLTPLTAGRKVVFFDLRGRGRSEALGPQETPTLDSDLEDLNALRQWVGEERIALLGWGYGAALSAQYALLYPEHVTRVVLVSPMPPRKEPYWKIGLRVMDDRIPREALIQLDEQYRNGMPRKDPEAWRQSYIDTIYPSFFHEPVHLQRMRSQPYPAPNREPRRVVGQFERTVLQLGEWDWRRELSGVHCPVLVVRGTEDPIPRRASEEWAGSVPEGRLLDVTDSGRMPWLERDHAFFRDVKAFLGPRN